LVKLGLLVGPEGYPLGYDVFEGNTYEGHTLILVLKNIEKKFSIDKPIIIADAGLLASTNIHALISNGYKFRLGCKIRNESNEIKDKIQKLEVTEEKPNEIEKEGYRLIVSFSEKRKKKIGVIGRKNIKNHQSRVFRTYSNRTDEEYVPDKVVPARIKNLYNYSTETNRRTRGTYILNYENLAWVSHRTKQE
jgi:transposase